MNRNLILIAILIVGILCVGIGSYLAYLEYSKPKTEAKTTRNRFPDMNGSPGKPPPAFVEISPDNVECLIVVPADLKEGVAAIDKSGRRFVINAGDQITLEIGGKVQVGSDRPILTAEGETTGYRDFSVDSPFKSNVGGLEFSIGSLSENRFLAVDNKQFTANYSGVPIFRIVDIINAYDGNLGGFTVTIKKNR